MARTPQKNENNEIEKDSFSDMISAFRDAVSDISGGHVKLFVKKPNENRHAYLKSIAISQDSGDEILNSLREDYPDGGEFLLKLCDEKGIIRTTKTVFLAALPERERQKQQTQNNNSGGGRGNNDMLIMMMNQQAESNRLMMQMMMTSGQNQMQMMTGLISAIVPAIAGNKGESAGDMVNKLIDAQMKLAPKPVEESGIEKTLDMIAKVRAILPDGMVQTAGDSDGIGGLAKAALPLLGTLAQAALNKPAPAPVPVSPSRVLNPVQKTLPAPSPVAAAMPETETENIELNDMITKFAPTLNGIKNLIKKFPPQESVEKIIDFVLSQIDADIISIQDVLNLDATIKSLDDQTLSGFLALWGFAPDTIPIIRDTLPLIIQELEFDPESNGEGGDDSDLASNADSGEGGGDNPAN